MVMARRERTVKEVRFAGKIGPAFHDATEAIAMMRVFAADVLPPGRGISKVAAG
jgi:hypothetical protein